MELMMQKRKEENVRTDYRPTFLRQSSTFWAWERESVDVTCKHRAVDTYAGYTHHIGERCCNEMQ